MQGWRRVAAAVLILLLVAAGGAALLVSSSGAEFLAGTLGQLSGRRVEIGAVDVHLGRTLEIELVDLRVYEPGQDAPLFRVDRAVGSEGWPRLLTGRVLPVTWRLERPVLVIRSDARGGAVLPALPPLELTVEDGSVVWTPASGEPIRVDGLRLSATQAPLRRGVVGSAIGNARRGDEALVSFAVEFDGWIDRAELFGNLEGLQLTALPIPGPRPRSGTASGSFELAFGRGVAKGSVDLRAAEFALELPGWHGPIAPRDLRLEGDFAWKAGRLTLDLRPLQIDALGVRGRVTLATGANPRLSAALDLDRFRPGLPDDRLQLLRLVGLRHKSWADADGRAEGGWIEDLRFELDVPLEKLVDTLAFRRVPEPDEIRLTARIRDGVYRPNPARSPLEEIEAGLEVRGNSLWISGLRMTRDGKPLPEIDIALEGMHVFSHLPPDERQPPRGPGVPIPGLATAFASLKGGAVDRAPLVLALSDFQIGYAPFVLPFRDGEVLLSFPTGRVVIEEAAGVLGGRPARIAGAWDHVANRVELAIRYLDGEAPPRVDPGGVWASGGFAAELIHFGAWPVHGLVGGLRAEGADVELFDLAGTLEGGALGGRGYVSFAEPAFAPYGFVLDGRGIDAAGVVRILEFEPGTLTGVLDADGTLAGRLSPERTFLEDADVRLHTVVQQGTLGNLPATVLIARLASPLGWTGLFGRPLPCDEIRADLDIRNGALRTDDFTVQGPELRILAAGEVDLLSEDLDTNMLVALLFLQSVDAVLERVPVVGRWMLGDKNSLVAVSIRIEGPWEDPSGSFVAPSTLQAPVDWAGRMIGGGLRRFRDMLIPASAGAPAPGQQPTNNGNADGSGPRQDPGP